MFALGNNATGSQSAYGSFTPNGVVACKFQAVASVVVTTIWARISLNAGFHYRCGLYDSAGTTRLGDTVEMLDNIVAPAWVPFSMNAGAPVTLGAFYYLAIEGDGSFLWLETDGGGFVDEDMTGNYPTWPGNVHSGSFVGNGHPSIYADGTPSGPSPYYVGGHVEM